MPPLPWLSFLIYFAGTGQVWESCPLGTFSTNEGLWEASQCDQCTPGFYCSVLNATAVTGPCAAGYYCTEGLQLFVKCKFRLSLQVNQRGEYFSKLRDLLVTYR